MDALVGLMLEVAVVAAVVVSLIALRAGSWVAPEALLSWSVGLIAAGFAIGLPAGLVYHVVLGRALAAQKLDARRWWLQPTRFHDALEPSARKRITPWFRVGAAGFLVVAVGCGVLFLFVLAVTGVVLP